MCLSYICLFVLYVLIFSHLSLPLGVGGWLQFLIVAFEAII